jgi:DUF4097 and DUF4098 domain-containing protein YvlB
MNLKLTTFALLLASACSYPQYQATKVVELELPAAALTALAAETHNGGISVQGAFNTDKVHVRAEMTVRGESQEEADANLNLLELGQEEVDGRLRLWGKYPTDKLVNRSPSFVFTLKVPGRLAVTMDAHNGSLKVTGIDGDVALTTHNGDIEGTVRSATCKAETHNGSVDLQFRGEGDIGGSISSHNGSVRATFADARRTTITASTHNGHIDPGARVRENQASRRELRGRIGSENTEAKLTVITHNGNVEIR